MPRRTGKAPVASSSSGHARRRTDKHKAGEASATSNGTRSNTSKPRGLHDVYDFAVEQQDGQGKKLDRTLQRVKAGHSLEQDSSNFHRSHRGHGDAQDSESSEEEQPKKDSTYLDDSDEQSGANAIAEEDDSDIDSDDAFAASDDERYRDVDFSSSRPRRLRHFNRRQGGDGPREEEEGGLGGDDGDDDDDGDGDDDDDMVDLSRMLDADSSAETDDEDRADGDEVDSSDDHDLSQLASAYAQPSKKRGGQDEVTPDAGSKRKRRVLSDRTEAMPESDFAAPSASGSGSGKRPLALEDFLAPLSSASPGGLSALRNDTRALHHQRSVNEDNRPLKASRRGGGPLAAPLPAVVKDRLQRAAGYELSRQEAEKWQSTIKRLREAEHISFPLQGGPSQPKATTAQMAATFKPSNAFESEIDNLLQSEGLSESQINKSEELAMRKLDPEEAARRRDELRKMRELMFRAEQKAKRVSKIKSKAYRKIARKEKEKELNRLREAGVLDEDGDLDDEGDMEGRAKAERDRAKERATLKHKNTGKWAKGILGRPGIRDDEDTRQAIDEQLQRSEQLRRRIEGVGDSSEEESSDYDEGQDGQDDPRRAAFDELRALDDQQIREAEAEQEADNTGKKGVWNMKFMQNARARDGVIASQARDELEKELRQLRDDEIHGSEDSDTSVDEGPVIGRRKLGDRNSLRAKAPTAAYEADTKRNDRPSALEGFSHEESPDTLVRQPQSTTEASPSVVQSRPASALHSWDADSSSNPWMTGDARRHGQSENLVEKSSSSASKSARKLEKRKSKADSARHDEALDAQLDIDPTAMLRSAEEEKTARQVQLQPPAASRLNKNETRRSRNARLPEPAAQDDAGAAASSDEELDGPRELSHAGDRLRKKTEVQRDLIAEAFAGDDVAAEFAQDKAREMAADAPREVDTTLPGWGAWGGKGIKKKKQKTPGSGASAVAQARVKLIPGLDPSLRRDAKMDNVIIHERKDKKAEKYKTKQLPYPYTSAEQYEATLAQPIGQEWNTLTQNQRLTMPRVLKPKPGSVIKPIQRVK